MAGAVNDEGASCGCDASLTVELEAGPAALDQRDRERFVHVQRVAVPDEGGVQRLDPGAARRAQEPLPLP